MADLLLQGCKPQPMAAYLKGIAVLRLVAAQEDPEARGCWKDQRVFLLRSRLDREGLLRFFLERYRPTPIIAPWNGGSGFYPNDDRSALTAILKSDSERFAVYRQVLQAALQLPELPKPPGSLRDVLETLRSKASEEKGKKKEVLLDLVDGVERGLPHVVAALGHEVLDVSPEALKKEIDDAKRIDPRVKEWRNTLKKAITQFSGLQRVGDKESLMRSCRNLLPDAALDWIDAAFALTDGEEGPDYAPLLGTGGNEGRLDFTNNFMQHLKTVLLSDRLSDREWSAHLLASALFEEVAFHLPKASIGQFDPGRAGGCNQGPGIENKDVPINPWDYVLTMEGALAFASSVARREGTSASRRSSPFTVDISRAGYPSTWDDDAGRSEMWLPLWDRPARFHEVALLFQEGRVSVGGRPARNGTDVARAAATLGVDRGIRSLVRYAFLQRRGDSYAAVPLGLLPVRYLPSVSLLSDLDAVAPRFRGLGKSTPARHQALQRRFEEAMFHAAVRGDRQSLEEVLIAFGRFLQWEALKARTESGRKELRTPMAPVLTGRWLQDLDDGSAEFRIAAAVASIQKSGAVGPIAANLIPIDPAMPWRWAKGQGQQAWEGGSLAARMASVLHRRMLDADRHGLDHVPIRGRLLADPDDVMAFLYGHLDDRRIEDLIWGFLGLRWDQEDVARYRFQKGSARGIPLSRSWCLVKLLFSPEPIDDVRPGVEMRIVPLLASGDPRQAEVAMELARMRLLADGLAPRRFTPVIDFDPIRMAAALLVPVRGMKQWKERVLAPPKESMDPDGAVF